MDMAAVEGFGTRAEALLMDVSHHLQAHPWVHGAFFLFLLLTWSHFKGDYGPQTWTLSPERPKALRGLVHVLVMPLRLLASLFSSTVALLVVVLLAGFAYSIWRIMQ